MGRRDKPGDDGILQFNGPGKSHKYLIAMAALVVAMLDALPVAAFTAWSSQVRSRAVISTSA